MGKKTAHHHKLTKDSGKESFARMNFEVPVALRNAFKAKVASQGKKVKDVFEQFMEDYIADKK